MGSVTFGSDPYDWYKFEKSQDGSFRINVEASVGSLPNGTVALYFSTFNSSNPGWIVGDAVVQNYSSGTWDHGYRGVGWYYIRIWAVQPTAAPVNYTINIENDDVGIFNDPLPNESEGEAQLIQVNSEAVGGHIDFISDMSVLDLVDIYKLRIVTPGSITVSTKFWTSAYESALIHPVVNLYDSAGVNDGASFLGAFTDSVTLVQENLMAGTYYISIAIAGGGEEGPGCGYRLTTDFSVGTSIQSSEQDQKVKVYPNPSNGDVHLYIPEHMRGSSLTVLDMTGRSIIDRGEINRSSDFTQLRLPSGHYMLRVQKDSEVQYTTFLIH